MKNAALKKLFAIVLVITMCVSLLPVSAAAEEPAGDAEQTEEVVYQADQEPTEEEGQADEEEQEDEQIDEEPGEEPDEQPDEGETLETVRVIFACDPAETAVTVRDAEGAEIDPEEDGSYLLVPGSYTYTASCEGYVSDEDIEFVIKSGAEGTEIVVALQAVQDDDGDIATSGTCGAEGGNLEWTLDENDVLTISGTGAMADYAAATGTGAAPWSWYIDVSEIKSLVIEDGVTSIGSYAFYGCAGLTSVTIPESVTSIGDGSFQQCSNLNEIEFCHSATAALEFGGTVFGQDGAIETTVVVGNIDAVNPAVSDYDWAGDGRTAAFKARDEGSASSDIIASGTCGAEGDNLEWTLDENGVLTITGTGAMADYAAATATGAAPWSWYIDVSEIKSLVIEDGVTSIGSYAFYKCTGLTSVSIPDGVISIHGQAFYGCTGLTSLTIPASVVDMGSSAYVVDGFGTGSIVWESGVTSIDVDPENAVFASADGVVYNKEKTRLLICPQGRTGSFSIPSGVTEIADNSFYGCEKLTNVDIPNTVTKISGGAFIGCRGLTRVTIPESVTEIEGWSFQQCLNLKEIEFCHSATARLKFVSIPNDGLKVFWQDRYDTIETTVIVRNKDAVNPAISGYDWAGDNRTVTFKSRDDGSAIDIVASGTCGAEGDNLKWTLDKNGALTISGTGAMADFGSAMPQPWASYNTQIKTIVIENGAATIGHGAFAGCTGLSAVTIPDSVTSIGMSAFANCTSMTRVMIPAGVTSIGNAENGVCNAFIRCSSLTAIDADPQNQSFASKDGILYDKAMETMLVCPGGKAGELVIPDGVKAVAAYAVVICGKLTGVKLPDSMTTIGFHAFESCAGLTQLTIPESVTSIGFCAFAYCDKLKEIEFCHSAKAALKFEGVEDLEPNSFYSAITTTIATTIIVPDADNINPAISGYDWANDCRTVTYKSREGGSSDGIIASGFCGAEGDNLKWTLDKDGVLTISGKGAMAKRGGDGFAPWDSHATQIKEIVIADGVTTISVAAFILCSELKHLSIPASVTNINSLNDPSDDPYVGNAWCSTMVRGCSKLSAIDVDAANAKYSSKDGVVYTKDMTELLIYPQGKTGDFEIPDGVVKICEGAFDGYDGSSNSVQRGLTKVTIPNSVKTIGADAFGGCTEFTQITIPESVTSIGRRAFSGCDKLKEIEFRHSKDAALKLGTLDDYRVFELGTQLATTIIVPDADSINPAISGYDWKSDNRTVTYKAADKPADDGTEIKLDELATNQAGSGGLVKIDVGGTVYTVDENGSFGSVEIAENKAVFAAVSGYNTTGGTDPHSQYPTGMEVYLLYNDNGTAKAKRIPEFDDLLRYSGCSIRITGNKGIRMITSVDGALKASLINGSVAGYTLEEYGTLLCFSSEMVNGSLCLEDSYARHNYAYSRAAGTDPVFKYVGSTIQYTNVLVGFDLKQCADDIAMRPYIVLSDESGNRFTIYGGIVQRSIGYIAYQNRSAFASDDPAYDYIWDIIHHVYGDKYDADYKK